MDTVNPNTPSIRDKVLSVLTGQKVELCFERELQGHEAQFSPLPMGLDQRIGSQVEAERSTIRR
jgi:hypothetical protein